MHIAGVPKMVLKPNLVSIASYPELSPPFESVIDGFAVGEGVGEHDGSLQDASRAAEGSNPRPLFLDGKGIGDDFAFRCDEAACAEHASQKEHSAGKSVEEAASGSDGGGVQSGDGEDRDEGSVLRDAAIHAREKDCEGNRVSIPKGIYVCCSSARDHS